MQYFPVVLPPPFFMGCNTGDDGGQLAKFIAQGILNLPYMGRSPRGHTTLSLYSRSRLHIYTPNPKLQVVPSKAPAYGIMDTFAR